MPLETDGLFQKAVIWVKLGSDRFNIDSYDTPIEIDCRWEDKNTQVKLPSGEIVNSTAKIMVDTDISLETVIRLGALADLPETPDNLHEVVISNSIPDLDGTEFQRTIITQRFTQTLGIMQ